MPRKGGVPENLKPFKKGVDERRKNNGRPPGKSISTILKEILNNAAPADIKKAQFVTAFCKNIPQKNIKNHHAIAARLYYMAIVKGDMRAIEEVINRTEGETEQNINIKGTIIKWGDKEIEL
jgi:hypothetical protein